MSDEITKKEDECFTLQQKATSFFKTKKAIHIHMKDGSWSNGYIQEVSSDFIILEEFKHGEIAVFFLEMKDIELYNTLTKLKEVKDGKESLA